MNIEGISLFWAFLAGIISFISPCVLPLIPGYVSFISGVSIDELQQNKTGITEILIPSATFVLGFSIVFVALGASASVIGSALANYSVIFDRIAGLLIIFFGLVVMGVIRIPWMEQQKGMKMKRPIGNLSVFVLGMAFAFAWTPCVGPILSSVFLLASRANTVRAGMLLLFIYSLGLGIPFIATALGLNRLINTFNWIKKNYRVISIISGLLLIVMGVLLATNQFVYIGNALRDIPSPLNWLPSI